MSYPGGNYETEPLNQARQPLHGGNSAYPGTTSPTKNMIEVSCAYCSMHWLVHRKSDHFKCHSCNNVTYLPAQRKCVFIPIPICCTII